MSEHDCAQNVFAVTTTGDAALVRAGVLDEEAIRAFTEGQCHALAYALHEATGWPVVAVLEPDHDWMTLRDLLERTKQNEDGSRYLHGATELTKFANHFFVQHPDGDLVDAHGRCTATEWAARVGYNGPMHDPRWFPSPDGVYEDYDDFAENGPDVILAGADAGSLPNVYYRKFAIAAARTLVPAVLDGLTPA